MKKILIIIAIIFTFSFSYTTVSAAESIGNPYQTHVATGHVEVTNKCDCCRECVKDKTVIGCTAVLVLSHLLCTLILRKRKRKNYY